MPDEVDEEGMAQARSTFAAALEHAGIAASAATGEVLGRLCSMACHARAFWEEVSYDLAKAATSQTAFLGHQRSLYWRHAPWRGVNLGGWLLLEPGPSGSLFDVHGPATCEWELMVAMRDKLGAKGAEAALKAHRETFVTEDDFKQIKAIGLNAVRIPFGYWAILGPMEGDVYVGPCWEYLERALAWCWKYGLQALLDMHGAPGGESNERPCGRARRDWSWQDWRMEDSVKALRLVAERFKGHPAVTGISVCNEPSETVPPEVLCKFYDTAVEEIRKAGMHPQDVSIVLPVYRTERLDVMWRLWNRKYDGFVRHANVAIDLHFYHCFGAWWQRLSLAQQLRMSRRHRKILRRVPAVVGEWSLALAPNALSDQGDKKESITEFDDRPTQSCEHKESQALRSFGTAQLEAYSFASHGWFFWNWCDSQSQAWDLRKCIERQWIVGAKLAQHTTDIFRNSN